MLAKHWQARHSPKTGTPIYERSVVLVLYREDYWFLLDGLILKRGAVPADFELVLASQPYRSRVSLEFKAQKVIVPLIRALGKGGCHEILRAVKSELANEARYYNFNANSGARAVFRYHMHALPSETSKSIGTSTPFAAWNAAFHPVVER